MTAQELINQLEKLEDKDVELYVNVHGREFWISEIAYSECLIKKIPDEKLCRPVKSRGFVSG